MKKIKLYGKLFDNLMKYAVIIVILIFSIYRIFAGDKEEIQYEPVKLVWSATCPFDSVYSMAMKVFKNYIESNSDIAVNIFTSGENLKDIVETDACLEGLIDITYFDPSYFESELPYLEMLDSAYIFKNYYHMKDVLNGEIGYELYDKIARIFGVRPLGAFYLGSNQLNLVESTGEVRTPMDMVSVRVSCRNDDLSVTRIKALGGIPVPYSDFKDIYPMILHRYSDGQDNEILIYKTARFYDLTKYIVLTNHLIKTVWPVINEERWQLLSESYRKLITDAVTEAESVTASYILSKEKEAVDYYESIGFIIIRDPDITEFSEYAQNIYKNNPVSDDWDMQLYNRIISFR